jgi:uncharacterized damage-inducible protein DinB
MMKHLLFAAALFAPWAAQSQPARNTTASPSAGAAVRTKWTEVRDYITQSAADMSEAQYAYRPTPDVRSFGELIGHLAGSQNMYCAIALGEKPPAEDAVEKGAKTKAALQQAWKESNAYCTKAYNVAESELGAMVDLFGSQRTKFYALMDNMSHDNEHYGNIVTYMRLNKLVPPSSRPR